ncbi:MAG: HAD family hydrolase, partial [Thermoplasmata archaeon]
MNYGLIFDVDGTIIDSFEAIYYALDLTLKKAGVMNFSKDELRSLMDYMSFLEIIYYLAEKYNVDNQYLAELSKDYVNFFLQSIETKMHLFSGIIEAIEKFSKYFRLGLISYNPDFILQEQVKYFALDKYFNFIRGYEDVNGKKRNGIIEFSKIYRIDKEKIAFIGDQPKDIIEAKAAGVISIAVSYGIGKKEIL